MLWYLFIKIIKIIMYEYSMQLSHRAEGTGWGRGVNPITAKEWKGLVCLYTLARKRVKSLEML